HGAEFWAAVLDPVTFEVVHLFNFTCGGTSCSFQRGDITDIPTQNLFIVTADTAATYFINPENYSFQVHSLSPDTGPTAYDPVASTLLFSNESSPSEVVSAHLTGFYPLRGSISGASYPVRGLVSADYYSVGGFFVLTGVDVTSGRLEVEAVNLTAAPFASYTESASLGAGEPESTVIWSASGVESTLVASDGTNQSIRLTLYSSAPYFSYANSYPMYPTGLWGIGVDSSRGIVIEGSDYPLALRAFYASNSTLAWTVFLSNRSYAEDLVVDSTLGTVYVSQEPFLPIEIFSADTGVQVGSVPTLYGASQIYLDPVRGELFVVGNSDVSNVSAYSLTATGGTFLGTYSTSFTSN
ncbi:MAG: hypothetical protein ACRD6W_04395, partial [Nitrososphaerales archaeon]